MNSYFDPNLSKIIYLPRASQGQKVNLAKISENWEKQMPEDLSKDQASPFFQAQTSLLNKKLTGPPSILTPI
jgi:hypothetical protein